MIDNFVIDGVHIYSKGPIKNKVIVFIHGNSLNALTFVNQLKSLDFPMIALDLPGHGLSERYQDFENIYNLSGYIKTVKNVINKLGLENFILAGHSLGGHIAIEASEELKETKGLFIFGTPPIGIPPEMDKMFHSNPAIPFLFSKEISAAEAEIMCNELVEENCSMKNEIKQMILSTDGNTRMNLSTSIAKGDIKNEIEILNKTKIPIAIIHGEHDKFVNGNYFNSLHFPSLWNNKIHIIKNCGHCPQLEQHEAFNFLLTNFSSTIFND